MRWELSSPKYGRRLGSRKRRGKAAEVPWIPAFAGMTWKGIEATPTSRHGQGLSKQALSDGARLNGAIARDADVALPTTPVGNGGFRSGA